MSIAPHRVRAYVLRHLYEVVETFDRKLDVFFWPTIDLLIFGLLSMNIERYNPASNIAASIVGGLILWSLVYNIQRDISVSLLEDAWSRNLYNLFSTPLQFSEVLVGALILSLLKAFVTIVFIGFLAWALFGFSLYSVGPMLIFFVLNLFVFGWAFGCITASLIYRFGTRVQIFAWSMIALIYPISGVFYPLSILPKPLAEFARLLPTSYIFEGLRGVILEQRLPSAGALVATVVLNVIFLVVGISLYRIGFRSAKKRGWFIHPS